MTLLSPPPADSPPGQSHLKKIAGGRQDRSSETVSAPFKAGASVASALWMLTCNRPGFTPHSLFISLKHFILFYIVTEGTSDVKPSGHFCVSASRLIPSAVDAGRACPKRLPLWCRRFRRSGRLVSRPASSRACLSERGSRLVPISGSQTLTLNPILNR
jgi:hypothetical protein